MNHRISIGLSVATILFAAVFARADASAVGSAATQPVAVVSPDEALSRLKVGNALFRADTPRHPRQDQGRRELTTTDGQHPFAVVLSCSDSRVNPELLFDQGVGDLFVVRVAGNVAGNDEMASVEYGVDHLHVPLLLVLGHEGCGAVTAAMEDSPLPPHIAELIAPIKVAVARARAADGSLTGARLLAAAVRCNVQLQMQTLLTESQIVREHVTAGNLRVVGGVYDMATGGVQWLGGPQAIPAAGQPGQPELIHAQ